MERLEHSLWGTVLLCIATLMGLRLPGPLDLPAPARLVPVMIGVWVLLTVTGHLRTPQQKLGMLWIGLAIIVFSLVQTAISYLLLGQPITLSKLIEFPANDPEFTRVSTRVTLIACPLVWIICRGGLILLRRSAA